jgi:cell division protein FtsB
MKLRGKREQEKRKSPMALWLFGAVVCSFLLSLFVGQGGMLRLREMRAHADQMLKENHRLALENRKLAEEIRQLGQDPGKIEQIAREELLFVSPKDLVLLVPK